MKPNTEPLNLTDEQKAKLRERMDGEKNRRHPNEALVRCIEKILETGFDHRWNYLTCNAFHEVGALIGR